jgi:hypothetical protein
MHLRDFARSEHPPTLFSAFLYFDISFMESGDDDAWLPASRFSTTAE